LPVLGDEIQLSTLARGLPGGIRQSREEPQNPKIGALASGLKQLEEVRIESEAEAVRAGDVPRILAGLNGRDARAEGTRCRRRHPRALSLRSWLDRRRLSPCSVSGNGDYQTLNPEVDFPPRAFRQTASIREQTVTGHALMIARGDVAEIEAFAIHRSVTAAIVAAAGGVVLGGYLAMRLGLSVRCQPSCGGVEAGILLSAIGIPVAAGFGGYYASGV